MLTSRSIKLGVKFWFYPRSAHTDNNLSVTFRLNATLYLSTDLLGVKFGLNSDPTSSGPTARSSESSNPPPECKQLQPGPGDEQEKHRATNRRGIPLAHNLRKTGRL